MEKVSSFRLTVNTGFTGLSVQHREESNKHTMQA